jgi:hypothetical protein
MKMPRALVGLVAALVAGVLVLTGCDSPRPASSTTINNTTTIQAPPSQPTNQASTPASVPPGPPPPPPATGTAGCGPDQATALRDALARLGPEPVTGRAWGPNSQGGNFDPCAELSTILIMIDGGTASSPMQALMFHRGTWLGTGTLRAYSFTSVDTAASTKDTVVLAYRSGQSCSACGDGILTRVRYHWDGSKVQMLDPPPPG